MGYAISVLLVNIKTCFKGNQTNIPFECMLFVVEKYLALPKKEIDSSSSAEEELIKVDNGEEEY